MDSEIKMEPSKTEIHLETVHEFMTLDIFTSITHRFRLFEIIRELSHALELHLKKIILRIPHSHVTCQHEKPH